MEERHLRLLHLTSRDQNARPAFLVRWGQEQEWQRSFGKLFCRPCAGGSWDLAPFLPCHVGEEGGAPVPQFAAAAAILYLL